MENVWKFYDDESDSKLWQNRMGTYSSNTPIHNEHDQPFDDFDRELLAKADRCYKLPQPHDLSLMYGPQRNALEAPEWYHRDHLQPSKHFHEDEPKAKRLAHADAERLDLSDCTSSDANVFSSPTISMLKKKQGSTNIMSQSIPKYTKDTGIPQPWRRDGQHRYSNALDPGIEQVQNPNMPEVRGIPLVPTSWLSDIQRSLFQFKWFNAVQSKCFPTAYDTDDNLVVSAPTGSGKTAIMELAMLRLIEDMSKGNVKIVYLAPTKSLCSERCIDWHRKFHIFGIHCAELTGDTDYGDMRTAQNASVIVTTPEKWDSITRKWKDHSKLSKLIRLFLIDEVHVLGDARGATVEAIVSRMKCASHNIRFVALSATIPNSDDIAKWLTRSAQDRHLPAIREVFDDSFRPVELKRHVLAYEGSSNPWAFDNALTEKLPEIVARYSKRKPVMIFCSTKDSAQKTAAILAESQRTPANSQLGWDSTKEHLTVVNELLRKVLRAGVAFHHASLSLADRKAVEQGFLNGKIDVICSTSTLAIGINLPCYLVILKGTCGYSDNGLREYSSLEIMQMLGRAGRPQFEREACAVILCHKQLQQKYENVAAGEETLESSLHQNFIEHLNAEVSVGTIRNLASAKQWLQSTFLYVRLQRNAEYYNMDPDRKYRSLDEALLAWCEKDLNLLQNVDLVENCTDIRCTEYGSAMAKYCVKFDTMKTFMSLPAKAKASDILKALSSAAEFCGIRVKQKEKRMYKEINKANETRYPIDVDIALTPHKISLIIQSKLGGIDISKTGNSEKAESFAGQFRQVQADTHYVFEHCKRLIRCLVDIMVQRGDSLATKNALEMARSLAAQAWDDTFLQLKQIQGIGDVFARKLAASGIKSVSDLFNTEAHRIEILLSKNPPFGHNILERASSLPLLHISVKELGRKPVREGGAEIKIRCEINFVSEDPTSTFNRKGFKVLFLCETSSGILIDFRCFPARQLRRKQEFVLTALVQEPTSNLRCHTMCDDVAGTHCYAEVPLNCPGSWFPVKQKACVLVRECTIRDNTAATQDKWEEFDDEGLDDTTLLDAAQACSVEATQDVYDIDDILMQPSEKKSSNESRKRRGASLPPSEDERPPSPARLPNGNWTCRHLCRDKNPECKHVCCKEGVKKKPSAKRRKKDMNSKLPASVEHAQGSRKATLKQTANPKIEDFFMTSNVQLKQECSDSRTSSSQVPVVERPHPALAKYVLPNTTMIGDRSVETASHDANDDCVRIEVGKPEETVSSPTEIVAAGSGSQNSSPKVISDFKKNSKKTAADSQSSQTDHTTIDTLPRNCDARTNKREALRNADALKEVLSRVPKPVPFHIEHEAKTQEVSGPFGRNIKFEVKDSSFRWFEPSQTLADEDQSHEIEEIRIKREQCRPKPTLAPHALDLEQKRYWDDLESDFLTYNNFSFVTVVPD